MKFEINLATRVYVNIQKVNLLILLSSIILIIWISICIYTVTDNIAEMRKFSLYKSRLDMKSGKDQVPENDYNKMLAEVKFVNSILSRRSYDWLSLLDQLESIVPDSVALRGLEPDSKSETLKISASARSFTSIRKFMENLEGSKKFSEIYLIDQSNVKVGSSQKGINFSVTCKAIN